MIWLPSSPNLVSEYVYTREFRTEILSHPTTGDYKLLRSYYRSKAWKYKSFQEMKRSCNMFGHSSLLILEETWMSRRWLSKVSTQVRIFKSFDWLSKLQHDLPFWHKGIWNRGETWKVSSPFCSFSCGMWPPWTQSPCEPMNQESIVFGTIIGGANWLSESRYRGSWGVNDKGWQTSFEVTLLSIISNLRLSLWMLVLSWRFKGLIFPLRYIDLLKCSKFSWIWYFQWGGNENGISQSTIWFSNFLNSTSAQGATLFVNEKGGGEGKKWRVCYSFEILSVVRLR